MKILAYPGNVNSQKSLIAANYAGVKIDYPTDFNMGVDNKTPEYLKKNPLGQVPLLDTPDGPIFESNSMARYVVRKGNDKGLYGANDYEACQVDQWLDVSRSIEPFLFFWVGPVFGYAPYNEQMKKNAVERVSKHLAGINRHLEGRTWFVGDRVTLADIVMFVSLSSAMKTVFDPAFRSQFPNVQKWFEHCLAQDNFKSVVGEFKFCEVEAQPKQTSS
jgi:elongation factor 1-gamma